jgi:hypothetical protein
MEWLTMSAGILDRLTSADFQVRVGFIATAPALYRMLKKRPEVQQIKNALASGELTEEQLRTFVAEPMQQFRAGESFRDDLALATLAVALEDRPTEFAEEFLRDLGNVQVAEMPMSTRVARECRQGRKLAGHQTAVTTGLSMPSAAGPAPHLEQEQAERRA